LQNIDSHSSNIDLLQKQTKRRTMILYNNTCFKHGLIEDSNPLSKIKKRKVTVENPDRLTVLLQPPFGILLSDFFIKNCAYKQDTQQAAIADIVRVHDYAYLNSIKQLCDGLKTSNFNNIRKYGIIIYNISLDQDTYISKDTFDASLFAAGSVIDAVEAIMNNEVANAFVAVRPPGHHAGCYGKVE
jgi:acetoin utilization deacetylase AcuC-like enzyme